MNACKSIRLSDGRSLAYAEFGAPNGKPIVHCHGTPSSRLEGELYFGDGIAADLGVRLILPDRPGIGGSDFKPNRQITDWPNDVLELTRALGLENFSVLGSSGGGPYAAACGALISEHVRAVGLLGSVAPFDSPGAAAALSAPLRMMARLSRHAPALLRVLFSLNLSMIRRGGDRAGQSMMSSFPEPDRLLLQDRPSLANEFVACFVEACSQGPRGAVFDLALMSRNWGFDLASIRVPVVLWHGEQDANVPIVHGRYLAEAIPSCHATFYPEEAHLSLPLHHQREILSALVA